MRITKKRIENFKAILLNILVVTSLFLTWQIWTFEPDYQKETDPKEASPVGVEDVDINQVVKPNQIVYHKNNQHFTSFNSETINPFYTTFISGTKIKSLTMENNLESVSELDNSVELIFPTLLSNNVLKKLISVPKDDIPLEKFDRIIIPSVATGENNEIIFLNTSSELGMRAAVEVSSGMKKWYEENFAFSDIKNASTEEQVVRAKSFQVKEGLPVFYIPIQKPVIQTYEVSTDELANEQSFIEALFPEQDRVERSSFNIKTVHTDGSRTLTFLENKYMTFENPPSTTNVDNEAPILNAYGFINKHFGFRINDFSEEDYLLSEWASTSKTETDQITFRLNTEGYPVFSSSSEDLDEINVIVKNNEVSKYKRMLKNIQYTNPIDERALPGYDEVLSLLNEGSFKQSEITNITIGFTIDRSLNQSQEFILVPQWYIKLNQTWTPIQSLSNEQGGVAFGLE
ncbi:YycH family regulatory protein [Guptibacillus hwajinpoensis]|uniref:Regulatory protein YycH of two-component signal transduction system YycFG n=1 Tax=Guptibacillus hwajinpoensis TaxID=208199 RepID=A0ABU0JYC6_9BACL|nr:two-component system activity regulator YycH [Alkalihalobacillus hemicentroti]MDQ0482091.1 regulatory protein YycH of two-component signal transduction system YycFG [Alkalihalobacillus hemicentroti]